MRYQGIGEDEYGSIVDTGWKADLVYFIKNQLPQSFHRNDKLNAVDAIIREEIDNLKTDSDEEDFEYRLAQVKTGADFEYFIKQELEYIGWKVRHTGRGGDQGADLIASDGNYQVVIQCKFYSKPLNNRAVQEVVAAQGHYAAQAAVIFSNQPLNKSGEILAKSNQVIHLFPCDAITFDAIFSVEASNWNRKLRKK